MTRYSYSGLMSGISGRHRHRFAVAECDCVECVDCLVNHLCDLHRHEQALGYSFPESELCARQPFVSARQRRNAALAWERSASRCAQCGRPAVPPPDDNPPPRFGSTTGRRWPCPNCSRPWVTKHKHVWHRYTFCDGRWCVVCGRVEECSKEFCNDCQDIPF